MALSLVITGCSSNSQTALKIGDTKVTKSELNFMIDNYYKQIGDFESAKKYAIDAVEEAILLEKVAGIENVELSADDEANFKKSKAGFMSNYGGLTEYKKYAKENGISDKFIEVILKQELYQPLLEDKLKSEAPGDEELKKYMQEKYYRAKHVLLKVDDVADDDAKKKEAEDILNQAKNGADFDKLVAEKSEDPGSISNANGYVFTDGEMVPSFEEGVKSIKPGEYTMVKSNYGYHVIKRLSLDPSDADFQSLFDENKQNIESKYTTNAFKENLKQVAADNGIEIKEEDAVIEQLTEPTPEPTEDPKNDPAYEDDGTTPKPEQAK